MVITIWMKKTFQVWSVLKIPIRLWILIFDVLYLISEVVSHYLSDDSIVLCYSIFFNLGILLFRSFPFIICFNQRKMSVFFMLILRNKVLEKKIAGSAKPKTFSCLIYVNISNFFLQVLKLQYCINFDFFFLNICHILLIVIKTS